jgi:hypothetical protein
MINGRTLPFEQNLLDEAWEDLASLTGEELDQYLVSVGLKPDSLLQDYAKALEKACASPGRARFEEARRQVHNKSRSDLGKVLSFDLAKKREILARIRNFADQNHGMTIAARNYRIEDEKDLDRFLEACVRLEMIDGNGNLRG